MTNSTQIKVASIISVAVLWILAAPGQAHATLAWYWVTSPTYINTGLTYYDNYYVSNGHALEAHAHGGARSGVWFSNSSHVRVSAEKYCPDLGCTVNLSWSGSYPSGYSSVHHHGLGANPDLFDGYVYDDR